MTSKDNVIFPGLHDSIFFVFEDALSGFSLLNDRSCSLERIVIAIFMMIITELLYFHIT